MKIKILKYFKNYMVYIDIKTVSYNELKNLKASEVLQFEELINENIDKQKLINKMFLRIMCRDTFQINAYKDNIGNIHLLNGQDEFYVIADLINENICIKDFIGSFKQFNNISYSHWQTYSQKLIKITPVFELHILECPSDEEKQFYLDMLK